jgi:hypothetical protein
MTASTLTPARTSAAPERDSALTERTAHALAERWAVQILDVVARRRPLHQVRDRLSVPAAGLLAALVRRSGPAQPDYRLRSTHACLTSPDIVEACAVLAAGDRVRSLTLRMERANMVWWCTMFALL